MNTSQSNHSLRVALLEDDIDQAALIEHCLNEQGHRCQHFGSRKAFLRHVLRESYDLFLMDWMLPDGTGIEALHEVRRQNKLQTPVIFITSRDAEADIVKALEAGADDYMAKPVRTQELLARVKAVTRRGAVDDTALKLAFAPFTFDLKNQTLSLNDEIISMTHREFSLALFMFRNVGKVISRNHLLEAIWGMKGNEVSTRTVDTHMSRLRKKCRFNDLPEWKLSAIYQHGYRLENTVAGE